MLTADLVRARVRGPTIGPIRPDPEDPDVQEAAERVVELLTEAAARRARVGEVWEELEEMGREAPEPKLLRGLAKIAQDACEVAAPGEGEDPVELRLELFRHAARGRPLGVVRGPFDRPTAGSVVAEWSQARGLDPAEVEDRLYCDLPAERRLVGCGVPSAEWLIRRYDVALVQALLFSATELRIALTGPSMPRMRQLVRWMKFHRLLHAAAPTEEGLEIHLDGPMSLFGPSTRYGLALAGFFPALLLQDAPWTMTATVLWTRARHRKALSVSSQDGFVSHYRDEGAYRTKVQEHFARRFEERPRGWEIAEGALPVALGDRELVFPDFTLARDGQRVHLEILGYWRAEAVERRLAGLVHAREPVLFALSRKLLGSKAGEVPDHPNVIPFADVLSVDRVVESASRAVSDG
jgi:hypothetical protein